MKEKIRIVTADDHPVARLAVARTLALHIDVEVLDQACGAARLPQLLDATPCDVLITDLSMPGSQMCPDGLDMLRSLRRARPSLRIVVLSMYDSAALIRCAFQIGVAAFVSKRDAAQCVIQAVRATMRRERYLAPCARETFEAARRRCPVQGLDAQLTRREAYVLARYLNGASVAAIAGELERSVKTVSAQRTMAMRKLWVDNDSHLFELAALKGVCTETLARFSRDVPYDLTYDTESPWSGS